jgi:transposase
MLCSWSIKPGGICQQDWWFPQYHHSPLPPKSPELNPVENIWQFMRDNWLSKPRLQIPRRSRRPRLRCMEQARRPAWKIMSIALRQRRMGSAQGDLV